MTILSSIVAAVLISGVVTTIPTTSAQSVDVSGLVAYYKFNEISGDLINLSPSDDSFGSIVDGIVDSGVIRGELGIIDEAYEWDGGISDRRVSLGTSESIFNFLHNSTAAFTVNFWIKPDAAGDFGDLLASKNNQVSNRGIGIQMLTDRTIDLEIKNGSIFVVDFSTSQTVTDDVYTMVSIRYDQSLSSNNAIVTFNGDTSNQETATKTSAIPSDLNSNRPVTLGTRDQDQAFVTFEGNLDEFSIWSRVLTNQEVMDLYNNGNGLELDDQVQPATCNGLTPTIEGTSGDEFLIGTPGDDVIVGLGGNDVILGNGGNDTICGGDGDDIIRGGSGDDTIFGDAGKDLILGEAGDDNLKGNGGSDRIIGGSGDDTIKGNAGNDLLVGNAGDDSLNGGNGTDSCDNTDGNDTVINCELSN